MGLPATGGTVFTGLVPALDALTRHFVSDAAAILFLAH
jgi:hypothetical protein